jgi:hypothetical protein
VPELAVVPLVAQQLPAQQAEAELLLVLVLAGVLPVGETLVSTLPGSQSLWVDLPDAQRAWASLRLRLWEKVHVLSLQADAPFFSCVAQ